MQFVNIFLKIKDLWNIYYILVGTVGLGRNQQMYKTQSLLIRSSQSSRETIKIDNNIRPRALMKKWDTEHK